MVIIDALLSAFNLGVGRTWPGPSSFANGPEHLRNEGQEWSPQPKEGEAPPPHRPMLDTSFFMDPVEVGHRVLGGILRNDIWIHI